MGEKKQPNSATMKPKAAAVPPASGTISCKAPQASPPCGKWRSMTETPMGSGFAVLNPSIPGNSRRNSAATAARFFCITERVGNRVTGGLWVSMPCSRYVPVGGD